MEILDIVSFQNLKSVLAGTIGGCAGLIVSHPFDTVKVRLQSSSSNRNTLEVIRSILKKEKVTGFYKGIASPMMGVALINSIAFGTYDNVLRILNPNPHSFPSISNVFLAGIAAGITNS